jgi:signal transduction histidine kinase
LKEGKTYWYVFVFLGLLLGIALFIVDSWLDIRNYPVKTSWLLGILGYMIFGGVIGKLLDEIFNEQKKRETLIKAEHKRLHDLFNSLPGIVVVIDENYKVHFANDNYNMKFGEREGDICYCVKGGNGPCADCLVGEVFRTGLPAQKETLLHDNKSYEVILQPFNDIYGTKLVIKTLYDITERKEAEQELSRLQSDMSRLERLNIVGQMAAGIAHEIRNPMTTVRGYLQLLGEKTEFEAHSSTLDLMIEELDRANSIITEFLSFVRNSRMESQYQNINNILQHLYPLLEADAYSQNKQINYEAEETPDILVNSKEISQLVLNLCRNGLEAMQEGGTLKLRTYKEDKRVVLSVEDEGRGICAEDLEKLGTPFFTTKENGTGLGLMTCYNIADRHKASIDCKSSSNGTTFFVRFPVPSAS